MFKNQGRTCEESGGISHGGGSQELSLHIKGDQNRRKSCASQVTRDKKGQK